METEQRDISGESEPFGRKQKIGIGFAVTWTVIPTILVLANKMPGTEWKLAVGATAMVVVTGLLGFAAWSDRKKAA